MTIQETNPDMEAEPHHRSMEGVNMPSSINDVLQLRKDKETYRWFFTQMLPPIIGKTKLCKSLNQGAKLYALVSTSDEAYGILLLENNWKYWEWEEHMCMGLLQGDYRPRPVPRYTTGRGGKARRLQGWSPAGVARYNRILEAVKKDRNDHQQQADTNSAGETSFELDVSYLIKEGRRRSHTTLNRRQDATVELPALDFDGLMGGM